MDPIANCQLPREGRVSELTTPRIGRGSNLPAKKLKFQYRAALQANSIARDLTLGSLGTQLLGSEAPVN